MSFEQTAMPHAIDTNELGSYKRVRTMHVMDLDFNNCNIMSTARLLGTSLNEDLALGNNPRGDYTKYALRGVVSNAGMETIRPLVKEALKADSAEGFSKCMFNIYKTMVSVPILMGGLEISIPSNKSPRVFLDSLKVKEEDDGSIIWQRIMDNINAITCDSDKTDLYGNIWDIKIYFLQSTCRRYGINVNIRGTDLMYDWLIHKDPSMNERFHIDMRGAFFNSLHLVKVLAGSRSYDGLLDNCYRVNEHSEYMTVSGKDYKVKTLTIVDRFAPDTCSAYNVSDYMNLPRVPTINELNYRTGKTAIYHKARYLSMKMAIGTNNVAWFNHIIEPDNELSTSTIEYYKYDTQGIDDRIGDISGVSFTFAEDVVRKTVIDRNNGDPDIKWMNRFVKWYTTLNIISTCVSTFSLIKSLLTTKSSETLKGDDAKHAQ